MATPPRKRILFLDAYDSFSNNITALLTTLLDVDVFILPIDARLGSSLDDTDHDDEAAFFREVEHYDAVVCGPGPGSPDDASAVGLMRHVWRMAVPSLGICLGFQHLALTAGARIRRLRGPSGGLHGMVRAVLHGGTDVFAGVGAFRATLYHSLCVDVGQDAVSAHEWEKRRFHACADVVPLAWVDEPRGAEGGVERILMAMRHKDWPAWGVQYHPESVCTEKEGHKMLDNWWREAVAWNERSGRVVRRGNECALRARTAMRPSLLSRIVGRAVDDNHDDDFTYHAVTLPLPQHVQVPDLVEALKMPRGGERIVLDSANAVAASARPNVRGRYSMVALNLEHAVHVEYRAGRPDATCRRSNHRETVLLRPYGGIWGFLADFQRRRRQAVDVAPGVPFLGGFMGYVSYEQGLSDIGVALPADRGHQRPDIALVWVTESIVVDHVAGTLHIQELRPRHATGPSFVEGTKAALLASDAWQYDLCCDAQSDRPTTSACVVTTPLEAEYEAKVRRCQDHIAAGHSYELCLTDQTTIRRPRSHDDSSWALFRRLRIRQPAPFAAYVRLGGATLVGASPERFLQYDRAGACTMRPMKGTVAKSRSGATTLAEAEALLHVPKEEAENLMIVDLVRHDLHGVCGPRCVAVPHLLRVEEHESVFQMVTVVQGALPPNYTGLDVLAASLPPGSMTGAPKKRSCELLRREEAGKERGLYAGVVGYMCASGQGDWSVVIRSLVRWDNDHDADNDDEVWRVGAGGAVTILSTPQGEREEMFTKLAGPLSVFSS